MFAPNSKEVKLMNIPYKYFCNTIDTKKKAENMHFDVTTSQKVQTLYAKHLTGAYYAKLKRLKY